MLKNNEQSYGWLARLLHWVTALLIIGLVAVGTYMTDLPDGDSKWNLYGLHKEFGVLALVLVTLRFGWKLSNIAPVLPSSMPGWQILASKATHHFLYLLMFVSPVTGVVMSIYGGHDISIFGIATIQNVGKISSISAPSHWLHVSLGSVWIALIIMHASAALYHHFIQKDNILKRMLFSMD